MVIFRDVSTHVGLELAIFLLFKVLSSSLSPCSYKTAQAKCVYKYRTRMANVKTNFKLMHPLEDLSCPDCYIHLDTQKHLLNHAETFIDKRRYNKL